MLYESDKSFEYPSSINTSAVAVAATDDGILANNYSSVTVNNAVAATTTTETSIINETINAFARLNRTTAVPLMREIIVNFNSDPLHLFDVNKNHTLDLNQFPVTASAGAATATDASHEFQLTPMSLRRTCLVVFFAIIILITIFGNTLVILSVTTTRRLRTVTNCFVMSLAIADWMVGVFVMPPAVLLYIYGKRTKQEPT